MNDYSDRVLLFEDEEITLEQLDEIPVENLLSNENFLASCS